MQISRILLLFLLCFIAVCLAYPQKHSKKKGTDAKSKSLEIKANVLVTDSEKQYINGIKKEDIKVFEDGVEQEITYFAEKKPVLNLGIVFDNTGSMRSLLDEIIWAGSQVVANMRETDEAFVVRFVDSSKIKIMEDWTSDRAALVDTLQNTYIEAGQSAVLDAIYLSAEKLLERAKEDKNKRYALLLISDVEERDSYYNFDETVKLFNDTDSQLFILSYAELAPKKKKLARLLSHSLSLETGGTIYTLSKKHDREELKTALGKIIVELRSNYVIGYTPKNQSRDGLSRKLTVQITDDGDGNKRNALIRDEFIIPKSKK